MQNPMFDKDEIAELTHEEYVEELEELGIETEGMQDFEMRMTVEGTTKVAEAFEEMLVKIDSASTNFNELVEMHQKLEPKHARSPKRYAIHKKAVERRRKRKNGGKK